MNTLYDKLNEYSDSDFYGFHMPGHKRNTKLLKTDVPYHIDITEIEGFDDLHHADGILREAQERAAFVYQAEETHFLVNGSTVGILSAVAGVTKKGDTVLVARNCHKSVYHAIYLNELDPVYLYPGFSTDTCLNTEISAGDVKRALERHPHIRAVIIVSPTYDGVVSDVEAIAAAAHEKGIPLIVDEAHGAHFGFHPYFPDNSNTKGADIVIHSLHKTLPSLTQTALLHMNGKLVKRRKVRDYLHMLQTSSPSYVLMASIDSCIDMLENGGRGLFEPYVKLLERTRTELKGLHCLKLAETAHFDRSKIVILAKDSDMTGRMLYKALLEDYHLQMEMAAGSYVLAMTSVADTEDGMDRLVCALREIDRETGRRMKKRLDKAVSGRPGIPFGGILPRLEVVFCSFAAAALAEGTDMSEKGYRKFVPREESAGCISLEYAYLYPPGTPLIVPGEKVSKEAAHMLQWYQDMGYSVEGPARERYIEVWMQE